MSAMVRPSGSDSSTNRPPGSKMPTASSPTMQAWAVRANRCRGHTSRPSNASNSASSRQSPCVCQKRSRRPRLHRHASSSRPKVVLSSPSGDTAWLLERGIFRRPAVRRRPPASAWPPPAAAKRQTRTRRRRTTRCRPTRPVAPTGRPRFATPRPPRYAIVGSTHSERSTVPSAPTCRRRGSFARRSTGRPDWRARRAWRRDRSGRCRGRECCATTTIAPHLWRRSTSRRWPQSSRRARPTAGGRWRGLGSKSD